MSEQVHDLTCRDANHGGPCTGPLRFALPQTPSQARDRQREAVYAVLFSSRPFQVLGEGDRAALVDSVIAAAETRI